MKQSKKTKQGTLEMSTSTLQEMYDTQAVLPDWVKEQAKQLHLQPSSTVRVLRLHAGIFGAYLLQFWPEAIAPTLDEVAGVHSEDGTLLRAAGRNG